MICRHKDPDAIYCLGDLIGYGAYPNEVIDFVRARGIPTVMGNYDEGVGFDLHDCGCVYRDALMDKLGNKPQVQFRRVSYDVEAAAEAIHTVGLPKHFASDLLSGGQTGCKNGVVKGDSFMGEKSGVSNPRAKLDQDLDRLRDDILRMGDMVDNAIVRAMEALVEQDTVLAQEVIAGDEAVNAMRFQVEEHCLSLIATQQPAAGDLRAIVAAMNIVSDLERMGDHAAGIAKSVLRGEDDLKLEVPTDIMLMAKDVREMLQMAFKAYRNQDLALAHKVAARDDEIDEQYRKLFRDLLQTMAEKPIKSGAGIRLQFASHNLERIADRATNLVERVIFQHSGEMQELNPEPGETGFN